MRDRRFDFIAGTGGVGYGILFLLQGDHPLGRNESRPAELTNYQDFCKLHIVLHYIARLIGDEVAIYPISRVGDDQHGGRLMDLMRAAGMRTQYVATDPDNRTLFSVCYQYPDGQGGNITTSNSACAAMTRPDIDRFFLAMPPAERGMVLAVPEVPLDVRIHLLNKGREQGCFTAASMLPFEAEAFVQRGLLESIDLLSISAEEAEAILQALGRATGHAPIEVACGEQLCSLHPHLSVVVTLGAEGSASFHQDVSEHIAPSGGTPINTAGAGDCFLGVTLSALAAGVPLQGKEQDGILSTATQLASLVAGIKIQSSDTIHFGIDAEMIRNEAERLGVQFDDRVLNLLTD